MAIALMHGGGVNNRPCAPLWPDESNLLHDFDDVVYWPDQNVGQVPPGVEIDLRKKGKPASLEAMLNTPWCVTDCERSVIAQPDEVVIVHNFEQPVFWHGQHQN